MRKDLLGGSTERASAVSGASGVGGAKQVPRRSVTITEENNSKIVKTRGWFMTNGLDINYATVLNFLIELGHKSLYSLLSNETKAMLAKYLLDQKLIDEGAIDEFIDIFYKRLFEEAKRRAEEEVRS